MATTKNRLLSVTYWVAFVLLSAFFCFLVILTRILTFPFDRNAKIANTISCGWGIIAIHMNPIWSLKVEGRKKIRWKEAYVYVVNHQSYFDIMVLYTILRPYKYLAKESLKKIPAIGLGMIFNQYIFVKRGDRKSRGEALRKCREWLKRGVSIAIFPEGTRSKNGQLQNFHSGAFRIAIEEGVPIVPVIIKGTRDILPRSSFLLGGRANISLKVQDPVPTKDYSMDQVEELKQKIHAQMKEEIMGNSEVSIEKADIPSPDSV